MEITMESKKEDLREPVSNEDFIEMICRVCRDFRMLLVGLEIEKDDFVVAFRRC